MLKNLCACLCWCFGEHTSQCASQMYFSSMLSYLSLKLPVFSNFIFFLWSAWTKNDLLRLFWKPWDLQFEICQSITGLAWWFTSYLWDIATRRCFAVWSTKSFFRIVWEQTIQLLDMYSASRSNYLSFIVHNVLKGEKSISNIYFAFKLSEFLCICLFISHCLVFLVAWWCFLSFSIFTYFLVKNL